MLSYIPKEKRVAFLTSVTGRYLESFPLEKDGRVIFKQYGLIVKACK